MNNISSFLEDIKLGKNPSYINLGEESEFPELIGNSFVKTVSVTDLSSVEILRHIGSFPNVEVLEIFTCKISKIEAFGSLKNISKLSITRSDVEIMFVGFDNLKEIVLSKCNLRHVPIGVLESENLEYLCLANMPIKKIPKALFKLINLKKIVLGRLNESIEIDPSIKELKRLKELRISGCSNLQFPEQIKELKNLETLNLSGCSILKLPKQIWAIRSLKKLSLTKMTNLKSISSDIQRLINLEILNIYWLDNLTTLPSEVGSLNRLKEIDILNSKKFKKLPSLHNLKNLNILKLRDLPLNDFPDYIFDLKHLKELSLTIKAKNRNLEQIKNLTFLTDLELKIYSEIPYFIFELKELKRLNIYGDNISVIPDDIIKLSNIEEFLIWTETENKKLHISEKILNLKNLFIFHTSHYDILQNKQGIIDFIYNDLD